MFLINKYACRDIGQAGVDYYIGNSFEFPM